MKRMIFLIPAIALCLSVSTVFAQESDVVYIEGWVDIRDSSGETYELFIGDRVYNGDTIITGDDGLAELEPAAGSRIIIKPGTVFSIRESDIKGKKQSVVSATLGQVSFKFNRMTNEPLISTPSTVMGVRGTEFTVYAGADGSSLVTVESGSVEVSGQGESVLLEENEGVEVGSGMPPGEKFEIKGKAIDYSEWNGLKINDMLSDPQKKLTDMGIQLTGMADNAEEWKNLFDEYSAELEKLKAERDRLFSEKKDEDARVLYKDKIRPLEIDGLRCVMNYRYYALSAMSLRRYVLSGFYVKMKTAYINDPENSVFTGFSDQYSKLIAGYEKRIAPLLVKEDY